MFLKHYWYEEPYGCTGGDRYRESDTHFARCPCGAVTRLLTWNQHESVSELNKMHKLFKDVEKVRDFKEPYIQHRVHFAQQKAKP